MKENGKKLKKGGKRMKLTNDLSKFNLTLFSELFQGVLKIETEVKGKQVSNCNLEPFFVVSLDVDIKSRADDLNECVKNFFSKRQIESEKKVSNLSQKSYLEKPPSILIFHLKTFHYDPEKKTIIKLIKSIKYEESLIIYKDYFSPSIQSTYGSVTYDLFSVIIHKGSNSSEGHYICYCKDDKGFWWNLDDSNIYRVDKSVIFKMRPYIMFYRKIEK